jgi:hypothetical protein
MISWKRTSIALSLLAGGLLALHFTNVPKVIAQTRAALVRSIDEPARVPYSYSLAPTCPFLNECEISFPVVPAGKRLRVTRISAFFRDTNTSAFLALCKNSDLNPMISFPLAPFNGFFFGILLSATPDVDFTFEAGETPVVVLGVSAVDSIITNSGNRLGVSGYLVDLLP